MSANDPGPPPQPDRPYPAPAAAYPQPPQPQQQQPQQQPYVPPAQPPLPPPLAPAPIPQFGYPQQPQAAYAQQAAFYGWGAPLPPPPAPRARIPLRVVAAASALVLAAALVLVMGLAMARPTDAAASKPSTGAAALENTIRALWRSVPANDLLPATLTREGTESYIRLGINPDETCGALPAAFAAALAPARCARVLTATYVDRTQTVTTTVGIVVLSGSTAARLRLFQSWDADTNGTKDALMPHVYAVHGTVAAAFADRQRVAWQSQLSTDGTYLAYAVAGFTDGRTGPGAAARAAGSGSALSSDSPPVQVAGDLPGAIQNLLAAKINAVTEAGSS
jgi:hypothetical protein